MRNQYRPVTVTYVALIAGLGGLLFGFDTGIIADVHEQLVSQFNLTTMQWSLVVSITVCASFLGALVSGYLADKYGRKTMIMATAVGFILGAGLLSIATAYVHLLVGRFVLGCCIGIASYACPLFISELAPQQQRGRLVLINSIAITFGEALSFITGYGLYEISFESWRAMFFVGVLPGALLLSCMFFIPASPRWLVGKGRIKEGLNALKKIRQEEDIDREWQEITSQNYSQRTHFNLFSKALRPVLLLGLSLGILQQFAGINTIMYYGPFIMKLAGAVNHKQAILATFVLGFVNALATLLTVGVVDSIGRRKLLSVGSLGAGLSLLYLAIAFQKQLMTPVSTLIALVSYIFFFAISLGSMFWLLISEIYPVHIRGRAMSFVTSIQWLANFLIAITFLPLMEYFQYNGVVFYFFSCMCFVSFAIAIFFVPETTCTSLESIEDNIINRVPIRDLGLARQEK